MPTLGRLIAIHTMPTGLLGPGGRLYAFSLRTPFSRTDLSHRKCGIRILAVTFHAPVGTGTWLEPGVHGKQAMSWSFS